MQNVSWFKSSQLLSPKIREISHTSFNSVQVILVQYINIKRNALHGDI